MLFRELHGACEGAVADDHQGIDVAVAEHLAPFAALRLEEICSGTLRMVPPRPRILATERACRRFRSPDQAFVALEDTRHFDAVKDGGADQRGWRRYAGGISTARQHSNALNLAHRIQGRECTAASALSKLVYF